MPLADDREEFKEAVRDILHRAPLLHRETDRVKCCEWVKRLATVPDDDFENTKLRNEYVQLLRIVVRSGVLHGIFLEKPPGDKLVPLMEALGQNITKNIPQIPQTGPIRPVIAHSSPDGQAYLSMKTVPGCGILCYMSVGTDEMV